MKRKAGGRYRERIGDTESSRNQVWRQTKCAACIFPNYRIVRAKMPRTILSPSIGLLEMYRRAIGQGGNTRGAFFVSAVLTVHQRKSRIQP